VLWQSTLCTWVLLASRRFITAETLDQWLRGGQLASQPAIWALFGCLIAGLARFTRDSLAAWRPETARRPVAVK
jgi:hypothetical protein